jgi:Zn-dependent protease/predicted transcriptional regulator
VNARWKIATLRGVPIYIASSFVWIALLYTYSLYLRFSQGGIFMTQTEALLLALFAAVLFFGSILLHELAHAAVARAFDLPVRGITLLFWGGATETKADLRGPKGEFLVSAAGPGTSLLLGGLFQVISQVLAASNPSLAEAFHYVGFVNVLLAGLNAIPGFPLDGGRMLLAAVWAATKDKVLATRVAGWAGMVVGAGFALYGLSWVERGDAGFGIWFFFLAWILISTARGTESRLRLRAQLAQGHVADAMRAPVSTVPSTLSLADALHDYLRDSADQSFPVVQDGRVIGVVSMESAKRVGGRDPMRPVRDGMAPLSAARVVGPRDTLDEVFEVLAGRDAMVLDDVGRLVGTIGPPDIERWFTTRARGEPAAPAGPAASSGPIPPRPDL